MRFIGSERRLNVWYEIHGTTNRQDAREAMIVFLPIGWYSPEVPNCMLLMPPAPKELAPAEQKPNKPIVQGRHP
jgi:hypothetical protein